MKHLLKYLLAFSVFAAFPNQLLCGESFISARRPRSHRFQRPIGSFLLCQQDRRNPPKHRNCHRHIEPLPSIIFFGSLLSSRPHWNNKGGVNSQWLLGSLCCRCHIRMVTTSKWLGTTGFTRLVFTVMQFSNSSRRNVPVCSVISFLYIICGASWRCREPFPPRLCPQTRALGNPLRVVCCFSFIWLLCRESPIVPALLAPHLCSQLKYRITCNCVFFKGGGGDQLLFSHQILLSLFLLSLLSPSSNRKFVFCHFPVATRRSLTALLARFAGLSGGRAAAMIRLWRRVFPPRLPTNWFPVTWLQRRKVSF